MATILSPRHKLHEFTSPEWQDEHDWHQDYGTIFKRLFHHYAKLSGNTLTLMSTRQHKHSALEKIINSTARATQKKQRSSDAAGISGSDTELLVQSNSIVTEPEELARYLAEGMYVSFSRPQTAISTEVRIQILCSTRQFSSFGEKTNLRSQHWLSWPVTFSRYPAVGWTLSGSSVLLGMFVIFDEAVYFPRQSERSCYT